MDTTDTMAMTQPTLAQALALAVTMAPTLAVVLAQALAQAQVLVPATMGTMASMAMTHPRLEQALDQATLAATTAPTPAVVSPLEGMARVVRVPTQAQVLSYFAHQLSKCIWLGQYIIVSLLAKCICV